MSDHVEGIVAKITEKQAGANGNTVYNICLEVGDEDEWYGHGFDEPEFQEGDEIEFDISWNGDYANIDTGTVNIISEGEPKPKSRSRGNSRSSGRSSSRGKSSGRSSKPSGRSSSRDKPAAKRGGNASKGKGADTTMSKDEWAQKDQMIRRQACMNTSIKLVTLLLSEGAITIPKKKADAADAIVALCDEEAERLYDQYQEQVYGGGKKRGGSRRSNNDYDDDIPE